MAKNEARIEELVHTRLADLVLFAKQWKHAAAEDVVQEAFLKLLSWRENLPYKTIFRT